MDLKNQVRTNVNIEEVGPPRNLEFSKQTKRAKGACMALHCRPLVTHLINRLCDVTSV